MARKKKVSSVKSDINLKDIVAKYADVDDPQSVRFHDNVVVINGITVAKDRIEQLVSELEPTEFDVEIVFGHPENFNFAAIDEDVA